MPTFGDIIGDLIAKQPKPVGFITDKWKQELDVFYKELIERLRGQLVGVQATRWAIHRMLDVALRPYLGREDLDDYDIVIAKERAEVRVRLGRNWLGKIPSNMLEQKIFLDW